MRQLTLRQATQNDLALTYAITADAMRLHVEKAWGSWDCEDQLQKHKRSFTPESHKIILVDGDEAGLVAIETFPSYTRLVKIYLLRAFRGLGIGSELMHQFIVTAHSEHKVLRLQVLKVNKRAQEFYFRHGFQVTYETTESLFLQK